MVSRKSDPIATIREGFATAKVEERILLLQVLAADCGLRVVSKMKRKPAVKKPVAIAQ